MWRFWRKKKEIDPDTLAERWKGMVEVLWQDGCHLADIDAVFRQVSEIVALRENEWLRQCDPRFLDWLFECYSRRLVMGLRAMIDSDDRPVSLRVLLTDMQKDNRCERVLARERFLSLYRGTATEGANKAFDEIAREKGAQFVSSGVLSKWLGHLNRDVKEVEAYCSRQIAHRSRDEGEACGPGGYDLTYEGLRVALRQVEVILTRLWQALTGGVLPSIEPKSLPGNSWIDVFRGTWLPEGAEVPPYMHLSDIELPPFYDTIPFD